MEIKLYLRMIQRSWWVVVLTALAAVLAALISSYFATPIYSASARYLVSPNPTYLGGDINYNLTYSLDTLDKRTIITTYAEVLNSPRIYTETVQGLGLQEGNLLEYTHTAVVFPETNVIDLTVSGPDPEVVVALTNKIGQTGSAYVDKLYPIYNMGLLDPATVPTAPIYPKPLRDAGVALAVGLALGIALALLRELLRAPMMNFLQQRRMDEMSQALKRPAFQDSLREMTLSTPDQMCLCFVRLEGLREYLDVLPLSTLQNSFRHITQVLKNQLRGNDLVARWDNLNYSVLLSNTAGKAAWNTMGRVQTALSTPIKLDVSGEKLELRPIIGIAEYCAGESADNLIQNAEQALEQAKKNGGIFLNTARETA